MLLSSFIPGFLLFGGSSFMGSLPGGLASLCFPWHSPFPQNSVLSSLQRWNQRYQGRTHLTMPNLTWQSWDLNWDLYCSPICSSILYMHWAPVVGQTLIISWKETSLSQKKCLSSLTLPTVNKHQCRKGSLWWVSCDPNKTESGVVGSVVKVGVQDVGHFSRERPCWGVNIQKHT